MKVVSVQNKIPFITRIGDFLFEKAVDGALYTVGGVCVLSDWAEANRERSTIAKLTGGSLNLCGRAISKVLEKTLGVDGNSEWIE